MTAVTADFYIGGYFVDQIYMDHDQVMAGTLDDLIDEARSSSVTGLIDGDGKHPNILVSVYISWHEHDVCENPAECKGQEPVVPTYEFLQGMDITTSGGSAFIKTNRLTATINFAAKKDEYWTECETRRLWAKIARELSTAQKTIAALKREIDEKRTGSAIFSARSAEVSLREILIELEKLDFAAIIMKGN